MTEKGFFSLRLAEAGGRQDGWKPQADTET
jgi:hypothetical protein